MSTALSHNKALTGQVEFWHGQPAEQIVLRPILDRLCRCRCGHSEYVYGLTDAELTHTARIKSTYPCLDCSLSELKL